MKNALVVITCLLLVVAINAQAICHEENTETKQAVKITAKGETYEQARKELQLKLPSLGLLQNLKLQQTKISFNGDYKEVNRLERSVNARFDYLLLKNCKYQGEYYVTATIPKKGISYIPRYPLIMSDKMRDYAYLKRLCGANKKMMIVISGPMASWTSREDYHAWRVMKKGFSYDLLCGKVAMKVKRCSRHNGCWADRIVNNDFDDFKVLYIPTRYEQKPVEDHTEEWKLEMGKMFLAGM
jgi:hypothetical protein